MLTDEGAVFFEGNVAAYRTPRRVFLSDECTAAFLAELRGAGGEREAGGGTCNP